MPIRKPKPTSPGMRFVSYPDFAEVTQVQAGEDRWSKASRRAAGATRTAARPRATAAAAPSAPTGAIDFKRRKDGVPAKVAAIEYDPNRSAYIALLHYVDGEKRYILAPQRLTVGMTVASGDGADIAVGNCMELARMPVGTVVHNIELQPGRGGQMARSAGASRPADGQGRRHGDAAPALRRDAHGARRVPRDGRHDRQRRAPEREGRQGRAQAPHGRAPADARRRR